VSAWLDGEDVPVDDDAIAEHLARCAACAAYEVEAQRLHRQVRIAPARPLPDLTGRVMAAVAEEAVVRRRLWWQWLTTRGALAAVGLAQLVLAIPVLVLGHDEQAPAHVAHELGSFGLAIGLGLLLAAARPKLAAGMLPIVAIIAALLLLTAGSDLALGRTQLSDEVPHLLDLAGFLLLWRLVKVTAGPGGDESGWATAPGVPPDSPRLRGSGRPNNRAVGL